MMYFGDRSQGSSVSICTFHRARLTACGSPYGVG